MRKCGISQLLFDLRRLTCVGYIHILYTNKVENMSVKYVRRNCDNVIAKYLRDKVSNKKVLLVEGARQEV